MRHIRRARVRILVNDRLELLLRSLRAFLRRSERREIRLLRLAGWTQRCLHRPHRDRKIEASLLVLGVQVVPAANYDCGKNDHHNGGNDQGLTMLDRPIGGLLGSADGHTAKCILFQLMAGFCAHKLPFWYERWLDKLKFYQYQNASSKRRTTRVPAPNARLFQRLVRRLLSLLRLSISCGSYRRSRTIITVRFWTAPTYIGQSPGFSGPSTPAKRQPLLCPRLEVKVLSP